MPGQVGQAFFLQQNPLCIFSRGAAAEPPHPSLSPVLAAGRASRSDGTLQPLSRCLGALLPVPCCSGHGLGRRKHLHLAGSVLRRSVRRRPCRALSRNRAPHTALCAVQNGASELGHSRRYNTNSRELRGRPSGWTITGTKRESKGGAGGGWSLHPAGGLVVAGVALVSSIPSALVWSLPGASGGLAICGEEEQGKWVVIVSTPHHPLQESLGRSCKGRVSAEEPGVCTSLARNVRGCCLKRNEFKFK